MVLMNAVLDGKRVYVDVPFEYPPYVLAWFAGPTMLAEDLGQFRLFFGGLILCLDALIKAALLWTGFRDRHRPPDALPFVMYTLATAALGHILLQRYDVIPAVLSVAAVLALSSGWAGVAGLMAAVAVGTKVYPAVFVPVLAAVAWRRSSRKARQFAIGVGAGLLPLIALSWSVPWWRFANVHAHRGLEAESLWASALWLSHFAGVPATWELASRWYEVTGPVAERLIAPARVVWATATLGSVVLATWAAWRVKLSSGADADSMTLSVTATLVLLPVTTFVAFSLGTEPAVPSVARAARGPGAVRPAPAGRRGWHRRAVVHLLQHVPRARLLSESDVRRRSRSRTDARPRVQERVAAVRDMEPAANGCEAG